MRRSFYYLSDPEQFLKTHRISDNAQPLVLLRTGLDQQLQDLLLVLKCYRKLFGPSVLQPYLHVNP